MVGSAARRPRKKRADRYHHGDLRRALTEEAVRTIQAEGVERLTLRAVGQRLGVSRTALYRHFTDKSALLAAVAAEGFRMLRVELVEAWERGGRGPEGFDAMGLAYVRFGITHPSHYRVMFGGFVNRAGGDPELEQEGTAAFQALVDSLVEQQQLGLVRHDDPMQLALYIWSIVHGVTMLGIDGRLHGPDANPENLMRYAADRIRFGITSQRHTRPARHIAVRTPPVR